MKNWNYDIIDKIIIKIILTLSFLMKISNLIF